MVLSKLYEIEQLKDNFKSKFEQANPILVELTFECLRQSYKSRPSFVALEEKLKVLDEQEKVEYSVFKSQIFIPKEDFESKQEIPILTESKKKIELSGQKTFEYLRRKKSNEEVKEIKNLNIFSIEENLNYVIKKTPKNSIKLEVSANQNNYVISQAMSVEESEVVFDDRHSSNEASPQGNTIIESEAVPSEQESLLNENSALRNKNLFGNESEIKTKGNDYMDLEINKKELKYSEFDTNKKQKIFDESSESIERTEIIKQNFQIIPMKSETEMDDLPSEIKTNPGNFKKNTSDKMFTYPHSV